MSFILNIKPKYYQVVFEDNTRPLIEKRSSTEGLKML